MLSVIDLLKSAIFFVWHNPRAIISRAIVPLIASGLVLYLSLSAYLEELGNLLKTGNEHVAGLVLAAATGGFLVFLLLHSILRISLAALALGREVYTPWVHFQFARREWRLYAANLRGLVVSIPLVVVTQIVVGLIVGEHPQFAVLAGGLGAGVIFCGLLLIEARIFLLAPAVTLLEKGQILRRSWRLSGSASWRLIVVCLIIVLLGAILENLSELLLRMTGEVDMSGGGSSLGAAVVEFQNVLPHLLAILAIPYLVTIALLTGAGMRAYQLLLQKTV